MLTVRMPARILDKHVGGNTTYGRNVAAGLEALGVAVDRIPSAGGKFGTIALETLEAMKKPVPETVLHYLADTGPLLPTRLPSVVTVHGVAGRWVEGTRNRFQEAVWMNRVRRAIACTSAVITVSESSARDVGSVFGVAASDIRVIPHGVDTSGYAQRIPLSEELRDRLPEHFVLYLGNIEPRKNIDALVRAFQSPQLRGIPLVIAGRPAWDYQKTLRLIESAEHVHYLGFVSDSDRIALLQATALFVFPSLYEGFGLPVLEALAAGTPVACSTRGSLPEVSGPAWRIDNLDPRGIAESLSAALADTAWLRSVRANGPAWAEQFTWAASVDAHLDLYRELAS